MKVPKLLQIQRSLASRISMWVVLYVVVILCIFAFVGRYYIEKLIWEILEHGLLHAITVRQLATVLTVLFVVMLIVLTSMLRRLIHRHIAPLTAFTEAADEVGWQKLMWGSDYPRTITAITYKMSYDFVTKSQELTKEQKRLFLSENAKQFFGFDELVELPYIKNMSE